MKDSKDIGRYLREDAAGVPETGSARWLLESASDDEPRKDDLARLSAALAPLTTPSLPPPPIGSAGPTGAGPGAIGGAGASATIGAIGKAKLIASVVAVIAAGGAGVWAIRAIDTDASSSARHTARASRASAHTTAKGPDKREAPPIEPRRVARSSAGHVPRAPARDLVAETAILSPARAALQRGDARAALAVVTAHARRFPNGAMQEERERIAIESLVMLGRTGEARRRAERFRARYPRSVQIRRIDTLLSR